ncbi:unnamed protein product [Candida verbasci]|uniref:Glutamate--cysteine ligase n=1 Tax=Candida verbasci TaxID=1227364 RepID=A0A9W4TSZ2_9ASCO|nr:unnamed protein product [Candida verbasci]
MGLLSLGTPLDWHESKKYNEHVRHNGITQLINIFKQHFNRSNDQFLWGDEVEYMMIDIDPINKTAKLSIDKDYILNDLNDSDKSLSKSINNNILFHPEYGRYMLEGTPLKPYNGNCIDEYVYVEKNMKLRRLISTQELPKHIKPLTITTFPRMGCEFFTSPPAKPIGPASQSLFLPDEIINRHARFPTLTANIRKRKGHKVGINLPLYPDKFTKLLDDSIPKDRQLFKSDKEPWLGASKPGHIYMDSMGFGMGSSCLQITMQCSDINEARYLYDSLAPITPIMLSLSAAAPIFKGFLVNQDVRWNVVSGAVDDRTFIEKSQEPYPNFKLFGGLDVNKNEILKNNNYDLNEFGDIKNVYSNDGKPIQRIPKSRYDSIDNYLSDFKYDTNYFKDEYNDLNAPINKKVYDRLSKEFPQYFDKYLSNHFAHLFIRDPLVIYSERINQDNELSNDHFENIQSTNWQTLRFKPPGLYRQEENISFKPGWRVEFRPMEVQLTDFENAAYSNFISLLSKAILKFKPNFYIPISKIEINMKLAHNVNSIINEKFWFKSFEDWNLDNDEFIGYDFSWFDRFLNLGNDLLNNDNEVYLKGYSSSYSSTTNLSQMNGINGSISKKNCSNKTIEKINDIDDYGMDQRYTIDDIINGSKDNKFPGLIKLIIKLIAIDLIPNQKHCQDEKLELNLIKLRYYLLLISKRAKGEIPTIANWLRLKTINNPNYKHDSKVSEIINYDLITDCDKLTDLKDRKSVESLFGNVITDYLYSEQYFNTF